MDQQNQNNTPNQNPPSTNGDNPATVEMNSQSATDGVSTTPGVDTTMTQPQVTPETQTPPTVPQSDPVVQPTEAPAVPGVSTPGMMPSNPTPTDPSPQDASTPSSGAPAGDQPAAAASDSPIVPPAHHGGSNNKIIIGGIAVFIVAIIGVVAYIGLSGKSQTNDIPVVANQPIPTAIPSPTPTAEVANTDDVGDVTPDLDSIDQDLQELQ